MKNVKELIECLMKIEDKENTKVWLEGCDCYGKWNGKIEDISDNKKKEILICRHI